MSKSLFHRRDAQAIRTDRRQAIGRPCCEVDPADPTSRARPLGVSVAAIFSYVDEEAPTTEAGWKFEGNTTRMRIDVAFPASVTPGSKVWLTAFYFNPRAMSGPAATPVSTYLPGGAAMAA